jgi:hypothetical protein
VLGQEAAAHVVHAGCEFVHQYISHNTKVIFELVNHFHVCVDDMHSNAVVVGVHGVLVHLSLIQLLHIYIHLQSNITWIKSHTYTYHVLDIDASNTPQGIVHDVGAMNELSLPLVGSFGTIISGCPYSAPSLEERFTRTESVGDSMNFRLHIVSIFGRMMNWLMQFVLWTMAEFT